MMWMDRKKLTLAGATLLIAIASYLVFSWGDRRITTAKGPRSYEAMRKFVSQPTTRTSDGFTENQMSFSPGEQTKVRVYDDVSGRLKYQLQAKKWEPVSDTVYNVEELQIEIYTPRGEISYINSDKAEITLARKSRNRVEPQRGWLKGHVHVIIDQTRAAWREAHPELAARDAHPDQLVHITLNEARFDLEQAELLSDSSILVDSTDARIENVRGLVVQWDQVDNRIDVLRFKEGGNMILRRGGKMIDFGLPGTKRRADKPRKEAISADDLAKYKAASSAGRALAMKPMTVGAPKAAEAATEIRKEGGMVRANQPMSIASAPQASVKPPNSDGDPKNSAERTADQLASSIDTMQAEARQGVAGTPMDVTKTPESQALKHKIQTYRAVFHNNVVVEQKDGAVTTGKIEADQLEINFDFSRKQQDTTAMLGDKKPTSRPAGAAPKPGDEPPDDDQARLTLAWNGPLEMHPLSMSPEEQSGQRFDAVATGSPVHLTSDKGKGTCKQLVYRHERKQVWLAGEKDRPVELEISESRKLIGGEIFFDQKRGLARVDGPGTMLDDRSAQAAIVGPTLEKPSNRPPVEITWTNGVDIEIGTRPSVDVAELASGDKPQKEYLRRAWFHGDVSLRQGPEHLNADEVAVTFGLPRSREEVADNIEHLDMKGRVRLLSKGDLICADHLAAQMSNAADGKNYPHIVDADGDVVARQGRREINADFMHVVLDMYPTQEVDRDGRQKYALGIEKIDARDRVSVRDPESNLFINDAKSLKASIRNGDQLANAFILSPAPEVLARASYGDMTIFGHKIDINMDQEAIDVPGPGRAWMTSRSDFGGRKLNKPARVQITWQDQMQFRLAKDYGVFVGKVRSMSDAFNLDCDKLTIRFGKSAPEPPQPAKARGPLTNIWPLRSLAAAPPQKKKSRPQRSFISENKKPAFVYAEGHAEAVASSYMLAPADIGLRELMTLSMLTAAPAMLHIVPDAPRTLICLGLARETRKWEMPFTPDPARGRLLSRISIFGDQVTSDLVREQMSVPGRGYLGIEDYQFASLEGRRREAASGAGSGPLMSSLRSDGPSQTLVSWENGMDYFVDRGMVAFDQNVIMKHLSGRQMVEKDKLASAFSISERAMRSLGEGRRASLTCGNLTLEFRGAGRNNPADPAAAVNRATDLERLIAKSAVHLQENTRTVMGEYLQYLRDTNEVRIEGGPNLDASITDQDERTQRLNIWRGPLLVWNRLTNRIDAPQAVIRSDRR